jgi:hypothetical protein
MVRVMRGGEEVKISKRAGSYVTLRDLIEWTSKDAVRFFLLSRKPTPSTPSTSTWRWRRTTTTRCTTCSTRMPASARCWRPGAATGDAAGSATCRRWSSPAALNLMLQLAVPRGAAAAAADFAPHDVTFYLRELAAAYHSYYDSERILVDDEKLKPRGWRWWPPARRYCTMAWLCWGQRPAQDVSMKQKATRQRHRRHHHRRGARGSRPPWRWRSTSPRCRCPS